jgi:hypothetical protein
MSNDVHGQGEATRYCSQFAINYLTISPSMVIVVNITRTTVERNHFSDSKILMTS